MSNEKEPIFDPKMISNYQQLANDIVKGRDNVKEKLDKSTTIDNQTRILLGYINHTSLDTLSLLCNLSAFNMALINDIDKVIDDLPEQFQAIKIKFEELVKVTKKEHKFVTWGTRLVEDLSKDLEKVDGNKK
jgi:hypothetical protein